MGEAELDESPEPEPDIISRIATIGPPLLLLLLNVQSGWMLAKALYAGMAVGLATAAAVWFLFHALGRRQPDD